MKKNFLLLLTLISLLFSDDCLDYLAKSQEYEDLAKEKLQIRGIRETDRERGLIQSNLAILYFQKYTFCEKEEFINDVNDKNKKDKSND